MVEATRSEPGKPVVVVFAMTETGHFQRLRPLVAGLAEQGAAVHVFTDRRFAAAVEEDGGTFVDLFAGHSLDEADDSSIPVPCRFVTFAGLFAEQVAVEVSALGAELVVYDTFAVVGRVVARMLGLPYVNVCAGHNLEPASTVAALEADPRRALAPSCELAVELLRDRYGIEDASPFSYVNGNSPHLNLCCEPPSFLTAAERRSFEPIAFHGSLPATGSIEARPEDYRDRFPAAAELKVYASFGTVIWRYWRERALAALAAISEAIGGRDGAAGLISLGGTKLSEEEQRRLRRPGVEVESYVDQWGVLKESDVLITHHGLNSTHEAIYWGVPMVSHPFFSDQPALAERCRELGLAVPLIGKPDEAIDAASVNGVLDSVQADRERMHDSLAAARDWELETIAARPAIWERIIALAGTPASP